MDSSRGQSILLLCLSAIMIMLNSLILYSSANKKTNSIVKNLHDHFWHETAGFFPGANLSPNLISSEAKTLVWLRVEQDPAHKSGQSPYR